MTEKERLADRVKLIREKLGLKQKDFADILGIKGGSLCEIEKGRHKPGHDFYYNISKKCNINLYYLLFGEGEMFRESSNELSGVEIDEHLKELIRYYNESKLVRFHILGYFNKMLLEFKNLITEEMEEKKKS